MQGLGVCVCHVPILRTSVPKGPRDLLGLLPSGRAHTEDMKGDERGSCENYPFKLWELSCNYGNSWP